MVVPYQKNNRVHTIFKPVIVVQTPSSPHLKLRHQLWRRTIQRRRRSRTPRHGWGGLPSSGYLPGFIFIPGWHYPRSKMNLILTEIQMAETEGTSEYAFRVESPYLVLIAWHLLKRTIA